MRLAQRFPGHAYKHRSTLHPFRERVLTEAYCVRANNGMPTRTRRSALLGRRLPSQRVVETVDRRLELLAKDLKLGLLMLHSSLSVRT